MIRRALKVCAFTACALSPALSRANGLEAPVSASAKHAAIGNAASSSVDDANALVLNPAGLAELSGFSFVVNAMPVMARSKAPLVGPNTIAESNGVTPMGEVFVGWSPIDGVGFALGVNAAGGMGGDYGAVHFGSFAMDPTVSQSLGAAEASLGMGAKLTPNLSAGVAWRMTYLFGDINTAFFNPQVGMLQSMSLSMSDQSFSGFRFGAQLLTDDHQHGLGLTVRTPVRWNLSGTAMASAANAEIATPTMDMGEASTTLTLPLQAALGAHVTVVEGGRTFLQYSFSDYSANTTQTITVAGMPIEQRLDWNDRHTLNMGYEQELGRFTVRGGYVFESAVVPNHRPGIYAPPGSSHSFAFGGGAVFGDLSVDGAMIYTTGGADASPARDAGVWTGRYELENFVASVSVGYRVF
jgi:long-subunit fatty acid transport protein